MLVLSKKLARILGLFLLFFVVSIPFTVDAATYTWDGGGGDENWSTCANWSSDICPLTTDSVIFSASSTKNVDIDTDITVAGFSINSGYTGTIAPLASQLITINGAFTQSDGTFTASVATTTVTGNFTRNAGTFNANGGIFYFLNGVGQSITASSTPFYDVAFGHTNAGAGITSLFTDITIGRNMMVYNSGTGGNAFTVQPNVTSIPRTVYVAGDIIINPMVGNSNIQWGSNNGLSALTIDLMGNLYMQGGFVFYSDIVFASSSDQTIIKTAGVISTGTDFYDTGAGDLIITADFNATSAILHPDDPTDFNFVPNAFTFTAPTVAIATGTTFAPDGPARYVINNITLQADATFNPNASTSIVNMTLDGGTLNAVSGGTTNFSGNFTYNSGTYNHNNGTTSFNNAAGAPVFTPGNITFNNVVFDMPGTFASNSYFSSLGSDMIVGGNLSVQNTNTSSGFYTLRSSLSGTPRTITVAGDLIVPSTASGASVFVGPTTNAYHINVILQGNLTLADSNATLYLDVTFASSSNQTITKTAGTIDSLSDWYDTGSGNLALTANFSGLQKLNSDSSDDFNFAPTAFTFTSQTVSIATGTSFTPLGTGSYVFSTLLLDNGGTFNATASTSVGSFTQTAGVFNAVSNGTTTFSNTFTYTSGTFNHNNGVIAFNNPGGAGLTVIPNGAVFNDVVFDMPGSIGSGSYFTSLGSDMTISGDLVMQNTNTSSGFYTFRSSGSTATRTIAIAGDLLIPSTSGTASLFVGPTTNSYPINAVLQGNLTLADSNTTLYLDVTFASSSNQTITKTAGTIDSLSDWYDTGSGNLALTANFSGTATLNPDSATDFNFAPTAFTFTAGSIILDSGEVFTPDGPSAYTFSGATTVSNGTLNASASTTFTAAFTLAGGVFNAASNATTTFTSSFTYASGTFNHNNGTVLFQPSTTMILTPGSATFYNVAISRTGGNSFNTSLASDMTIDGNLYIGNLGSAQMQILSSVSGTPRTVTVAGNLVFPAGSTNTVYWGHPNTNTTFLIHTTLGGNIQMEDSDGHLYSDVTMSGNGTQTITKNAGTIGSYADININKTSGTVALATTLISSGAINIATGTLRTAGFTLTTAVSGLSVGAAGNLQIQGGEAISTTTFATSGTMTYEGTSGPYTLKNWSYKNLTIQGTGATFNLPATLTGLQNVNIASGTLDVTASNHGMIVQGNWINTGIFNPRSGTVTLSGTNQTITGTTTFYNLTKSVATADTLTFGANQTQTISNTWTANGAPGQLLSLRSTTPSTRWNIDPQATRTLSYIDVQDSNNTNGSAIGSVVGIVNSGNNLNWGFDTTPPGATSIVVTPATSTASITWNTDEEATSIFKYGLTSAYGNASTSLGTSSHSVIISGLTPETTYHYAIVSSDGGGNTATTTDATFVTEALPDTTPPDITTIASSTGTSTATISWVTTENASSSVLYGTTISYGSVATSSGTTTHSVNLSGLTPSTIYHFSILALDAAINASTTADMTFTTAAFDPTAPTVSMTAPANLATVSGASVALTANASDNTAVVGVQFKLNTNTNIGSEDMTSAYGVTWDSTAVADGAHTIIAVARDAAGNYATSSVVSVTVDNTAPVRSAGSPTTTLSAGTTNTTLSVTTDESATCKYDTTSGTVYGSMSGTFSTTGGTNHSTNIVGLVDGVSYTIHMRCVDGQGNANTSDYSVSFAIDTAVVVAPAPTPDRILGAWNQPTITGGTQVLPPPQLQPIPPGLIKFIFKKDLAQGMNNADIKELQKFLNNNGFAVAKAGAGSPGKETTLFGPATKAAVLKFQTAKKIKGANGRFGPATREVVNGMR